MAIAFVNNVGTNLDTTVGATTMTLTPAQDCGAGNFIALAGSSGNGKIILSVTDTKGNTWFVAPPQGSAGGATSGIATTLQDFGTLATTDTINVTWNGTGANKVVAAIEFSGVGVASYDQATGATGTTSTTPNSGATGTTTQPNELVLGAIGWQGSAQRTFTKGVSYAAQLESDEGIGAFLGIALEYKIVSAVGQQNADGTLSLAPTSWNAVCATYIATVIAGPSLAVPDFGRVSRIGMSMAVITRQIMGDWSAPTSPLSTQLFSDSSQPLVLIGGPVLAGVGGMKILQPQPLLVDAVQAGPVVFATPVAAATAAGPVSVLQSTHAPAAAAATAAGNVSALLATYLPAQAAGVAAGNVPVLQSTHPPASASATAAGNAPALLDTHTPAVAAATAAGNVPVLIETYSAPVAAATAASVAPVVQATFTPAQAAATAAGNTPAMLISFDVPVAGATAAAAVPLMEITSDPAQQPLVFMGGLTRIGVSGPLLQGQQLPVGDVAGVNPVLFAVPVASATGAGLAPVVQATFTPAEGDVAASSSTNGLANTFDGGTNGVAVSIANSGGLSGDAFGNVTGTVTYTSAVAAHGALSATVLEPNGGAAANYVAYTGLGSLTTQTWGRAYFRMDSLPTSTIRLVGLQTFAGLLCTGLRVDIAGLLRVVNGANTGIGTASTVAVPLNQWFRVEYRVIPDVAAGESEFRVWFNADSSGTPDWASNNTGQVLGSNLAQARFGIASAPTAVTADWNLWIDEANAVAATWPGPASGLPPVMQLTYAAPVALATSAGNVPLMEITSDAAMLPPLVLLGGLPRIGVSGPLLQQSMSPVGDAPGVNPVLFAVPVASATSVGLNPVLMATFTPAAAGATSASSVPAWPWAAPVGSATATSSPPVWQDTHLPGAASATAAGQAPVLAMTYSIVVASATAASAVPAWPWSVPVASATADGLTPALLITFGVPVGSATAAAPVPFMQFALSVLQDPIMLPFWGPLRTIPGSMTILAQQDLGAAQSNTLYGIPVASASASGPTPTLLATYVATVASATAASATPVLMDTWAPAVASAIAAGQTPVVQATYIAGVASATAAGLTPVMAATYGISVASAVATGLAPVRLGTLTPGTASATAAANTPVISAAYLPASAFGTAAAPVVTLRVTFTPAVGSVTAVALIPVLDIPGSTHTGYVYAVEGRTTMTSIGAITLSGETGATTRTAAPPGEGQGQASRTGATGPIDP